MQANVGDLDGEIANPEPLTNKTIPTATNPTYMKDLGHDFKMKAQDVSLYTSQTLIMFNSSLSLIMSPNTQSHFLGAPLERSVTHEFAAELDGKNHI